jgi:hypothetical protein
MGRGNKAQCHHSIFRSCQIEHFDFETLYASHALAWRAALLSISVQHLVPTAIAAAQA